jgi:arylsulfatase
VEYVFFGAGDMQPPLKFAYALDGSETKNRVMMGRGIEERVSKTAWDGNKFVITTRFAFPDPVTGQSTTTEMKQVLSLENPTTLVVETTRSAFGGGAPTITKTTYTKM